MNTLTKLIFLSNFLLASTFVSAQKDLNIATIFDDYGKLEGSILIELAKDVLGNNTKIEHYKSLIILPTSENKEAIEEAIQKDIEGSKKIMETRKDGKIETAYYCLKKKKNSSGYQYILFNSRDEKMTLIYVKGDFPPSKLEKELETLKDLFIKINNKRIKL